MDLKGLSKRMTQIAVNVEGNTNKKKRVIALEVDKYVVLQTPVDTGRARANWQVGLGAAVTEATERTDFGNVLQENERILDGVKSGQDVWLSNNVDYIGKLNEGHSKQANPGYIQAAVIVGVRAAQKIKLTEK